MLRVASGFGTVSSKLPSRSHTVPFVVPSTRTEAPMTGYPEPSFTVPLTCWANATAPPQAHDRQNHGDSMNQVFHKFFVLFLRLIGFTENMLTQI